MMGNFIDLNSPQHKILIRDRLESIRQYLGMSQTDFSGGAGMKLAQYNNWIRARQHLSLQGAMKINQSYGISLDFMFLGDRRLVPPGLLNHLVTKDFEGTK